MTDEERIDGPFDVSFRVVGEADLPDLMRWLSEPEVVAYYGDPPASLDAAREDYVAPDLESLTRRFVIEWRRKGVGEIQHYQRHSGADWAWDAGIDIFIGDPETRGRGVGIEAIRVMLRHLFEVKHVHRVFIDPEVGNPRAIHVYKRAGFHLDGVVRHNAFDHGEYVDTQYLTILEDEWPAARARWEAERGPRPS